MYYYYYYYYYITTTTSWLRGTAVERRSLAGERTFPVLRSTYS